MNIRSIALSSIIFLGTASMSPSVHADDSSEDAVTTMARARFREGVEFYDKGHYDQARASFLQVYALKKHPAVLLNLAWSCLKGGHPLEAQRHFKQFLLEATDITDKARNDANDGERQALEQLALVEIVAAAGSTVAVDGVDVGAAPLHDPMILEAGAHAITIRSINGTSESQSVSVAAGERTTIRAHNADVAAPAPALPSSDTTNAAAPPTSQAAPSQPESIVDPSRESLDHVATHSVDQSTPSPLTRPANLVPAFVLGGIALAAYGTATALFIEQQSALNRASQVQGDIAAVYPTSTAMCQGNPSGNLGIKCNAYSTDNDNANADALWGDITLGVGIAATAGFIVYWLVADKHPTAPTSTTGTLVVPLVGANSAGVSVMSRF
jgi:hypothetical protein